jgi:hypothetical protein
VVARGKIPAFEDIVYRGAVSYDAGVDVVTLLYSGARFHDNRYTWRVATEQMTLDAFLARVNALAIPGAGIGLTSAPPLTDADAP